MYFPFLRAKQYELLALRQFASEINNSKTIKPIIEPVKKSKKEDDYFKNIETALVELMRNNINYTIIINPNVGGFKNEDVSIINFIAKNNAIRDYDNFQIGIHTKNEVQISQVLNSLKKYNLSDKPITLIHNDIISNEDFVKKILNETIIKYNLFNESHIKAKRYRKLFKRGTQVILDDAFILKEKNADYQVQPDEFYSDEYLTYKEESYVGFSDFLTIGENFSESGFLPYAVAIHITYLSEDDSIRIRHFVSDTNDDNTDVAGKYGEALEKLIAAIPEITSKYKTKAIEDFKNHYSISHYPGLGSIKKLSILNHLELMKYLLEK